MVDRHDGHGSGGHLMRAGCGFGFARRRRSGVSGGGAGVGALTPTFDNRYGTDTAGALATGKFRFALKAARVRTFVDSVNGSDAASGLAPGASAKRSWAVGWAQHISGYVVGDQFCVAGGEGQTYSDPGTLTSWRDYPGDSAQYPHAVLSYDSRDATNEALVGWATGAAMPILDIAITGTPCLSMGGDSGTNCYAFQGIRLRSADPVVCSPNILIFSRHDDVVFNHFTTERVTITNQHDGVSRGRTSGFNVSMFSQTSQWSPSGNIGMLIGTSIDNVKIENAHSYHVGWRTGANRNATNANGGASFLDHDIYKHASNGPIASQRVISIMPANDGDNLRGSGTSAVFTAIRAPIAVQYANYSASQTELPAGATQHRTDDLFIDSAPIDDGSDGEGNGGPRGMGYIMGPAIAGSTIDNVLAINNSQYGLANNCFISTDHLDNAAVEYAFDTAVALTRVTSVGWSPTLKRDGNGDQSKIHLTWANCDTDTLAPGVGNVLSSSVTYAAPKTNKQIYDAVLDKVSVSHGGTEDQSLAKIVNLIHHRPDLAGMFSQAFLDVCFPSYNKVKTYIDAVLPNLSAEVPADIFSGPTNPSVTNTWNSSSTVDYSFSGGDLTATRTSVGSDKIIKGTKGKTSGFFTITGALGAGNYLVGLADASEVTSTFLGASGGKSIGYSTDGNIYYNGSSIGVFASWAPATNTIKVDFTAGKVTFYKDGVVQNTGGTDVSSGIGTGYTGSSTNTNGAVFTLDPSGW
jgi:hypothetical protein